MRGNGECRCYGVCSLLNGLVLKMYVVCTKCDDVHAGTII